MPDEYNDTAASLEASTEEKMPHREWEQSDRRAENLGIRKEKDELRIDSWIHVRSTG